MAKAAKYNTNGGKFQYGKEYYFQKSCLPLDEFKSHRLHYHDMDDEIYLKNLLSRNINMNKNGCENYRLNYKEMNSGIYDKSLCNKNSEQNTKSDVINANASKETTIENKFQYGKTYYFDRSGLPIDKNEIPKIHSKCKGTIDTCCLLEIPKGFRLTDYQPEMCFNLSELSCIKNPIIQKVNLNTCGCEHTKHCEVVAGYEIRAVGEINFSSSIPICPISGFCSSTHSHVCCSNTVSVNDIISNTCCPKPDSCNKPCIDWSYAYFCTTLVKEDCASYIRVKMGVALEYVGNDECDEE